MATLKPFILDELPGTLEPSALYFIKHPLDPTQMQVHVATLDGTTTKCVYTTSPIANMQPALYDATDVTYAAGDLTSKKFYLDSVQVGELTYHYTAGELTAKKFYLGGTFIGKLAYTYTAGEYTGSTYSLIEN